MELYLEIKEYIYKENYKKYCRQLNIIFIIGKTKIYENVASMSRILKNNILGGHYGKNYRTRITKY